MVLKQLLSTLKKALSKTRSALGDRLKAVFGKPLDESTFEELEHILYEADLGSALAANFVSDIRVFLRKNPKASFEEILFFIREKSLKILEASPSFASNEKNEEDPLVVLIVGVNGSGKTTSIAKLAKHFQAQGKKVLLAAADTFRSAATEQLEMWAQKIGVGIITAQHGSDPSSVVFDALSAAKARKCAVVLIDTAGRLQNKTDLMRELEKMRRVSAKVIPLAPHETFLVLDATTGQNALDQAKIFHSFTPLTGIILSKLDGSAKGGIALAIKSELGIPIRWIGVGEAAEDFLPFDPKAYVDALFSN